MQKLIRGRRKIEFESSCNISPHSFVLDKMKLLFSLSLLSAYFNSCAHTNDTIPKMLNRQGIFVDTETISFGAGYSLNYWNGIGFRNYYSLTTGINFYPIKLQENALCFGPTIYVDHNHRMSLYRLAYFTYGVGYSPIISFNPAPETSYKHDVFKHQFYLSIGMNFVHRKLKVAALLNVCWIELKDELFYTGPYSYLQIYPSFTIRFFYFFKQKVL